MNLRGHSLRLAAAIGAGSVVGLTVGLAAQVTPLMRVILGFDAGALLYLAMVWQHLLGAGEALSAAAEEDQGHIAITVGVILAAAAGMAAIVALVGRSHTLGRLAAAVATILTSWLLVQTVFAAHYANQYRKGMAANAQQPGLDFPGGGRLTFMDFVYVAFTVGLTFQVSDVTTTTAPMRRIVTAHALMAFVFNTAVIAIGVGAATAWF